MTHMRYWAFSLSAGIGRAFIAIERFAFASTDAVWIAFAVATATAALSLAATVVALPRENHTFSGLSAVSAVVAAWTTIATRAFTTPTALWMAFAGGAALLMLSLRALALHETTVERVVQRLELNDSGEPTAGIQRRGVEISGTIRTWLPWLGQHGRCPRGRLRRGEHVRLAAGHRASLTPLARVRDWRCHGLDRAWPARGRLHRVPAQRPHRPPGRRNSALDGHHRGGRHSDRADGRAGHPGSAMQAQRRGVGQENTGRAARPCPRAFCAGAVCL